MVDLRREVEQRARILARLLADDMERELVRTSPVDTGHMRNQTTVRDEPGFGSVRVVAEVDTPYARYVSSGTRPHIIRAKNARALRFQIGAETIFRQSVNHPGTQPNPWWTNQIREVPERARRIWGSINA